MAGLGAGLAAFLVLGIVGILGPDTGAVPLIFIEFLSLVLAGYVGGRFAPVAPLAHGGLSGLLLFLAIGAIAIAAARSPSLFELGFFGIVAAVLGTSGAAIAGRRDRRD
jgi:hypothetical protein